MQLSFQMSSECQNNLLEYYIKQKFDENGYRKVLIGSFEKNIFRS